jgi:hypothetical protein
VLTQATCSSVHVADTATSVLACAVLPVKHAMCLEPCVNQNVHAFRVADAILTHALSGQSGAWATGDLLFCIMSQTWPWPAAQVCMSVVLLGQHPLGALAAEGGPPRPQLPGLRRVSCHGGTIAKLRQVRR